MDDFGNDYQDDSWFMECQEYGHSMATYGFFDDVCFDICFNHSIDWAACEV